jgi:hypothetical protein
LKSLEVAKGGELGFCGKSAVDSRRKKRQNKQNQSGWREWREKRFRLGFN